MKKNGSPKVLERLVLHSGFKSLEQYMRLYSNQVAAIRDLEAAYPEFGSLDIEAKKAFIRRAYVEFRKSSREDIDALSSTSCAEEYEAEKTQTLAARTADLITCGVGSAVISVLLSPLAGGVTYGACAGAVYAEFNAQMDAAYADYQDCLNS